MDRLDLAPPEPSTIASERSSSVSHQFSAFLRTIWRANLLPKPDLNQLRRKADAVQQGDPADAVHWREPFERLVESLIREAELNEIGLTFAYVQLLNLLKQRARAQRLWADTPEISQIDMPAPVIILGQMRSGTTRLHRMLGCDPRFNHTRFYEVMNPLPDQSGFRVVKSWAQLQLLDRLNPQVQFVHPTSARSVEEVFGLLSFSFYGAQIEAQWRVPDFARYWEAQDKHWVYREFRQLLNMLAWQRGETLKPWVLKAPQFMEDLAVLLKIAPGARLVCLHRDTAEVVASSASLVWNQMRLQSDAVDRRWIGREWTHKTRRRKEICTAVRTARPDIPQIDTSFAAMNSDWRTEIRRIYAFLELELLPEVENRMDRYLRAAEKSGFRQHSYRASDFGLPLDGVGAAARN